jgi:hypothetical protein
LRHTEEDVDSELLLVEVDSDFELKDADSVLLVLSEDV